MFKISKINILKILIKLDFLMFKPQNSVNYKVIKKFKIKHKNDMMSLKLWCWRSECDLWSMSAGSEETAILRRCRWFSLPEQDLCWIEKLEPAKNWFTNNSLKNILQKLILTVCFVLFLPNMSVDCANTAGKPKAACELRSEYPCYRYSFHCSPALSN